MRNKPTNFGAKTELIVPEELYEIIRKDLVIDLPRPTYSRVILPLSALLEGEIFNEYIKRGNVLMLSEGRIDRDNVYYLRQGVLTLHLDKESYERAGLVGKPDGVKGKRGTKPRWVVELELRSPSMLHGKKGFDRIVYAFKNVLNTPVTWLFLDLETSTPTPSPMERHFPLNKTVSPDVQEMQVNMPSLQPPTDVDMSYGADFEDYAVEVQERYSYILQAGQDRMAGILVSKLGT
ncbi:ribonuclease P 40kDa subunit [Marssonina coronariae]|uniref:Ribonuclease P 40kDa subunit n=1 Tax=Diplocarpon coronariae TaxID=2795749 RepID=A0A218Z273_9HELO|nr:ribonuclease P 40kDa subunit [Marssonina coronariae]